MLHFSSKMLSTLLLSRHDLGIKTVLLITLYGRKCGVLKGENTEVFENKVLAK